MKKKVTPKSKAVDLAKLIAKTRAGFVCLKCGRSRIEGWQMHGAHIMPETWAGTAADPENILCFCASCHSMGPNSAHQNPVKFTRWLEATYPGLYDRMEARAVSYSQNPFPKIDWEETRTRLKAQLDELTISV